MHKNQTVAQCHCRGRSFISWFFSLLREKNQVPSAPIKYSVSSVISSHAGDTLTSRLKPGERRRSQIFPDHCALQKNVAFFLHHHHKHTVIEGERERTRNPNNQFFLISIWFVATKLQHHSWLYPIERPQNGLDVGSVSSISHHCAVVFHYLLNTRPHRDQIHK